MIMGTVKFYNGQKGFGFIAPDDGGTRLTIHNVLEGHGFGKILVPLALRAARKDADAFAQRIKQAVESS